VGVTMPRHVDHDARRAQIIEATLGALAEHGPRGLTFRAVAQRMGGSTTFVTHYFASRQALIDALAESVATWPQDLAELELDVDDPMERLRLFMQWMVPIDEQSRIEERARLSLIGETDSRVRTRHLVDTWDTHVRDHFRRHLEQVVPPDRIEPTIDLLRAVTNGITLSAIEHPDDWPPERQFAVIDDALAMLEPVRKALASQSSGGRRSAHGKAAS
jgi:AcrR family transcriptional regulator